MQSNPWIGFALIALGLAATLVFAKAGIPMAAGTSGLVTLGIAFINGSVHSETLYQLEAKKTEARLALASLCEDCQTKVIESANQAMKGKGDK